MKILDLMDEIIAEVENGKKGLFSTRKTIDVDYVLDILDEIREALPNEMEQAREVVRKEHSIIERAEKEANRILKNAQQSVNVEVDEHQVTRLAYEKANRMVDGAQKQVYELRVNANHYAVEVLDDLTAYLKEYIDIIKENKSNFINKKNKDQAEFEEQNSDNN